ncbi:MAG: hypothetical protein OEM79_01105 [Nitrosopumilus sp.]|nr:hypothetical protein [Nitrosopumilus sp.]
MKKETKTKTKKTAIVLLLSLTLLASGNLQVASAQNLDTLSTFNIHVAITPSHVSEGSETYPIGYVYILNKNGVAISTFDDVDVYLTSDNPSVASVPEKIIFPANADFAKFDITTGQNGKTIITAELKNQIGFTDIQVGSDNSRLPDDLVLELNIPTEKMHVNSEMPFSAVLKTSDDQIVRAPYDIEIILDYQKSLAVPNEDKLVIKSGEFYAWGTITTFEKVGNAYLRAIQADTQLDTAVSISISSTLPAALNLNIYPYLIPAEIDRTIDIFVSVVDSNGDPTVASEDIPLKFFSNNQDYLGDDLDDTMEETNMVIKKGEFGYHFKQNLDLIGLVSNDLLIGVSSAGMGVAIDKFQTVGESISIEDQRISGAGSLITSSRVVKATDDKSVQLFGPLKIPSNSTALFAYQIAIEEDDDDDDLDEHSPFEEMDVEACIDQQFEEEEFRREGELTQDIGGVGDVEGDTTQTGTDTDIDTDDCDVTVWDINHLEEGNKYPIQANEDYRATGLIQLLDVISEDSTLGKVVDAGNIRPSYSYGVAEIETTQKSGEFLISAQIKGVGSGSIRTEVVNSLEQKQIKAFSPTGEDTILINRDGSFDVFLVALDASDRPKVLEEDKRYLITPSNGVVDIVKGSTFGHTNLQSESFSLVDGGAVVLKVAPIGQDADLSLESTSLFETQLSSKINVLFPLDKLDIEKENHVGVIQMVDLQGNPIKSFKDIRAKIISSNEGIVRTLGDAVIKQGDSYAEFPIETTRNMGSALISSTARGVVGGESTISTSTSSSSLTIVTSGLVEPMPVNQEVMVKIFVDDDTADSVAGATVRITSNVNATVNPDLVRTGSDGSATFTLTALNGPEIPLDFSATAEGYRPGNDSYDILVDTPAGGVQEVQLPQELVYVIIGGIVIVAVVVGLFLKKSKEPLDEEEEPWEDEDI